MKLNAVFELKAPSIQNQFEFACIQIQAKIVDFSFANGK